MAAAIAMIGNSIGCVSLEHYVHRHVFDTADHEQSYYHCPHCGQIIAKHGTPVCPKCCRIPAFYGYEPTCWRQFPAGWGCPPETIFAKPGLVPPGLLEVPEVIELPRGGEQLLDPYAAPPSPPVGAANLDRSSSSDLFGVHEIESMIRTPQPAAPQAPSMKVAAKEKLASKEQAAASAAKPPVAAKEKLAAGADAKPKNESIADARPLPRAALPAPARSAPQAKDPDLFPLDALVQKRRRPQPNGGEAAAVAPRREMPTPYIAAADPPRVQKQTEPVIDPLPPSAMAESLPRPEAKLAASATTVPAKQVSMRVEAAPARRPVAARPAETPFRAVPEFSYVLQSTAPTLAPATVLLAADVGPGPELAAQSVQPPHQELPTAASGSESETQMRTVAHFDPTDFSQRVVVPVGEDTALLLRRTEAGFHVEPAAPLMLDYLRAARPGSR